MIHLIHLIHLEPLKRGVSGGGVSLYQRITVEAIFPSFRARCESRPWLVIQLMQLIHCSQIYFY